MTDWLDDSAAISFGWLLEEKPMSPIAVRRQPTIAGPITPERFAKLTQHLRVNGKPLESMLHRLQDEKRGAESQPASAMR